MFDVQSLAVLPCTVKDTCWLDQEAFKQNNVHSSKYWHGILEGGFVP
jgi:hypothetical protein